jgi:hypothetical protein
MLQIIGRSKKIQKLGLLSSAEFNNLIDKAVYTLTKIDVIYCKSDNEAKRKLISSMCVENFTFENLQLRTTELTESFKIIYLINKQLEGKKSETTDENLTLSRWVPGTRFELVHPCECHPLKMVRLPISPPGPNHTISTKSLAWSSE